MWSTLSDEPLDLMQREPRFWALWRSVLPRAPVQRLRLVRNSAPQHRLQELLEPLELQVSLEPQELQEQVGELVLLVTLAHLVVLEQFEQ